MLLLSLLPGIHPGMKTRTRHDAVFVVNREDGRRGRNRTADFYRVKVALSP